MDETQSTDAKAWQALLGRELEEAHELYAQEGLTPADISPLDETELVYQHTLLLECDASFGAVRAAVTEALDLPWQDGASLRERFSGTGECC